MLMTTLPDTPAEVVKASNPLPPWFTDRQVIAAMVRWARRHGWTSLHRGWIHTSGARVEVFGPDDGVPPGRTGRTNDWEILVDLTSQPGVISLPVRDPRTAADLLVALGLLAEEFSSAHAAGFRAGSRWAFARGEVDAERLADANRKLGQTLRDVQTEVWDGGLPSVVVRRTREVLARDGWQSACRDCGENLPGNGSPSSWVCQCPPLQAGEVR